MHSLNTTQLLLAALEGHNNNDNDSNNNDPPLSLVVQIGDLSYAEGFDAQWDGYFHQIQPVASRVPWMASVGNHERASATPSAFHGGQESLYKVGGGCVGGWGVVSCVCGLGKFNHPRKQLRTHALQPTTNLLSTTGRGLGRGVRRPHAAAVPHAGPLGGREEGRGVVRAYITYMRVYIRGWMDDDVFFIHRPRPID